MFIVGLGGPSCTGKSTVAKLVASKIGGRIVSMESYYRDQSEVPLAERMKRNYDSPDSVDANLLFEHIRAFSAGEDIEVPVYDFAEHTRAVGRYETLKNSPVLIVEGILVLHWAELRSYLNLSVYFDAPDTICFQRRRVRDIVERQRSNEFVAQQYENSVLPMAVKYIYPTKFYADMVVDATQSVSSIAAEILAKIPAGKK